ncbi:MAG TPA: M20/M25/M40 family metallo-hydrolase, partial [Motilibacterales bacterium]|nr:M20/M25/M40 family metallo-hydrolase [Motilibacterales bacterium]
NGSGSDHVLVVYAHPNPQSFTHAVLDQIVRGLADAGHSYEVLDLYAIGFNPVFSLHDSTQFIHHTLPDGTLDRDTLERILIDGAGNPLKRLMAKRWVKDKSIADIVELFGANQPAPPEQGWTIDPFTATRGDDGRIYGRGSADDISGLVTHLGMMRVFDGRPPCTLKLILEGMEETESNLEAFVEAHPDLFGCDLFVICDMGNLRVGEPVLTTALRGDVACVVTVRTLDHPLHSGVFGGPTPDAMMALARLLSTLHDDQGNVAVEGVSRGVWEGEDLSAADFRASADVLDGVALTGSGRVGDLLWAQPSVSAIGVDMTPIATSSNVLIPEASAKISMRIVPGAEPKAELDALVAHLESHAPWGAQVEVRRTKEAPPFLCGTDGPGYAAARAALEEAFGRPAGEAGCGGSIPLLRTLQQAAPGAEFVLWGPEDVACARIHASDESVDPAEIECMVVAQALLLERLAAGPDSD